MGGIFENIIGGTQGYALEDSDFDPMSDDSDIDSFFNQQDEEDSIVNTKAIRKSKKIFNKTSESDIFGGF